MGDLVGDIGCKENIIAPLTCIAVFEGRGMYGLWIYGDFCLKIKPLRNYTNNQNLKAVDTNKWLTNLNGKNCLIFELSPELPDL